jgi:hypothetical protein
VGGFVPNFSGKEGGKGAEVIIYCEEIHYA